MQISDIRQICHGILLGGPASSGRSLRVHGARCNVVPDVIIGKKMEALSGESG
jgi:hypothetical protein